MIKSQQAAGDLGMRGKALFLAFGLTMILFCWYGLGFFGLVLGIPINFVEFPAGLILATFIFWWSTRPWLTLRQQVEIFSISTGLLIFSGILSFLILDTSWDGQWYHQFAIMKLMNGWNPVQNPFYKITKFDLSNHTSIQHFPKFSWITAAVIAKFTGFIETGKLINQLIAWAAFFNCCYVLGQFISKRGWNIAVSLLLTLNPVLVTQLFSDYVDGTMYALLLLILLQLVSLENGEFRGFKWVILGSSIIMVSNIKFTGLILSGVIIICFAFYWLIRHCPVKFLVKMAMAFTLCYSLAFLAFGYNPYLTNIRSRQQVFYPINNPQYYEAGLNNEPRILEGKNNLVKWFYSLVSKCNNLVTQHRLHWKDPLTVSKKEVLVFSMTDVRLSGFGFFFQLVFWISLVLLIRNAIRYYRQPLFYLSWVILAGILVSTLISPVSWWARLTPQFYIFPFLAILPGLGNAGLQGNRVFRWLSKAVVIVLGLNILLIAGANFSANIIKTQMIRKQLSALKKSPGPVRFDFDHTVFQATRERLREAGVNFVLKDTLYGKVMELQTLHKMVGFGPKYQVPE